MTTPAAVSATIKEFHVWMKENAAAFTPEMQAQVRRVQLSMQMLTKSAQSPVLMRATMVDIERLQKLWDARPKNAAPLAEETPTPEKQMLAADTLAAINIWGDQKS